ncbi:facilitated trehalose transporter Tret1-like isoform X1 [Photinus pyralis]|uniref:facilitated trehalose transporter Tret1-like isoform X1 n=1 Tax=Photinus pyralis TaxID=7054 RepID=UPI001266ECD5|nr:facilitated trehalose transporter Tret1-like isoform X1 [Photinus pyralis]
MRNLDSSNMLHGRFAQFIAVFTGTISAVSDGMQYGWTAPVIPILESPNSPVPITEADVVWLENIYMLGGFAGLPLTIFSVDKFGRKYSILIAAVQNVVAWFLIAFAPSVEYLYVARFLSGIAGDVAFVSAPMYIGEIADQHIRGILGSFIYLMMLFGIVVVYSVAPFVSIPVSSAVGCSFLLIQILSFPFMPESPYYLLVKDKKDEARRSLQKLRAVMDVEKELEEISRAVERQKSERGHPLDLILVKSNRKAIIIMTVLNCAQHFSSISVILMNIHSILEDAASMLSPSTAAIIFAVLMLTASCVSASLIDKAGRKILLSSSSILTGISLLILASYFSVKNSGVDVSSYNWVPVASVMLYAVTFKYGLGMVPIVMTAELFPTSVKAVGMTVSDAMYVIFAVVSIYLFQHLKGLYGMHVPFFIFASSCFITAVFTIFCIPETKGKTLEEIQQILKGNTTEKTPSVENVEEGANEKNEDTRL